MDLTTRELASLVWIGVAFVGAMSVRGVRAHVPHLLRAAFTWKLTVSYILLVACTVAFVVFGYRAHLWSWDLLKPTIVWFLTTALVMFFGLDKAMESRAYFRRAALRTIEIPVFLQFLADLFPLSIWVEIPMQGVLIVLVLVATVGRNADDDKQRALGRGIDVLLGIVGIALLAASLAQVIRLWRDLSLVGLLKEFVLPVWLTLALLPFMYGFALFAAYGKAFTRINLRSEERRRAWRAKAALLLRVGPFLYRLRESGPATYGMVHADSLAAALGAFDEARLRRLEAKKEELLAKDRLRRYAGVKGVDADGLQLDRREFEETIDALQYLAMCHMGHHRNLGRYRTDMLDLLGDTLSTVKGLPEPHGVQMRVAEGGRHWYAWRTLPSGWVLGIGASGPPPSQWYYDASMPPSGPPKKGLAGWFDSLAAYPRLTHWP